MTEEIITLSLGDVEPKMKLRGVVKQVQLAGAIINVGVEECDAVLHISQIRRRRVNNVSDHLKEGQKVTVWVRSVDKVNARMDVTMIKPPDLNWDDIQTGQVLQGKIVRIEKFGVFVDVGAERPGLVHISELTHGYVKSPEEVVQKGQDVEVKVVGVNRSKHQIDLSMKAVTPPPSAAVPDEEEESEPLTAMAVALQRAMADSDTRAKEKRTDSERSKKSKTTQDEIIRRTLERHE